MGLNHQNRRCNNLLTIRVDFKTKNAKHSVVSSPPVWVLVPTCFEAIVWTKHLAAAPLIGFLSSLISKNFRHNNLGLVTMLLFTSQLVFSDNNRGEAHDGLSVWLKGIKRRSEACFRLLFCFWTELRAVVAPTKHQTDSPEEQKKKKTTNKQLRSDNRQQADKFLPFVNRTNLQHHRDMEQITASLNEQCQKRKKKRKSSVKVNY